MGKHKGRLIPGSNPSGNPRPPAPFSAIHQITHSRQGPIPSPEEMERYAALAPGMVERIMSMAEQEATNRHQFMNTEQAHEGRVISFDGAGMILGMVFALIIALAGIGAAAVCITRGYEIGGGILGAGTLGTMVSTFIVGRRMRDKAAKKPST